MDIVTGIAKKAKAAAASIAAASTGTKNNILACIAKALIENTGAVLKENKKDIDRCRKEGIQDSLLDRLMLNDDRIKKIAASIDKVIKFNDPVGEVIFGYNLPNGLILKNIRVPLGVVAVIYEARPNVTIDASVLCLKAGNCIVLRGSSHALNTNIKLVEIMKKVLKDNGFPEGIIQIIPSAGREHAVKLMQLREYIDVLIPRGGAELISSVVLNSKIPVIETGVGNCHIYIDKYLESISINTITDIIVNAKTQRPSVCNAAEKLLVHSTVAEKILPPVLRALGDKGVKLIGGDKAAGIYQGIGPASEEDWYREFLSLKIAVKVVDNIEDAVLHINKYGSHHTETIITSSYQSSNYFTSSTDSSTVFVNASTRFTDGEEFGMGAEMGISTQKLHWRGPMGLGQITTNKFIVLGQGHIRE
ncbi:MAG TPA: glutamate-5-semialdehyde dehydrogenase [Actinobacteria bacterium]|nr:glutamate-5-semialdehyde dehydrogenase [Actinomycetota bacterium]